MNKEEIEIRKMSQNHKAQIRGKILSFYRMRRIIGLLGMALPLLVIVMSQKRLPNISSYYYSVAGGMFSATLFALGFLLISYRGYERNEEKGEWLSDNVLTNIAGLMAIVVAFVPVKNFDYTNYTEAYFMSHSSGIVAMIHYIAAALSLLLLAIMVLCQFTKADRESPFKKIKNYIYQGCGWIIIACVISIIAYVCLKWFYGFYFHESDLRYMFLFVIEALAVYVFSFAWLLKGWKGKKEIEEKLDKLGVKEI